MREVIFIITIILLLLGNRQRDNIILLLCYLVAIEAGLLSLLVDGNVESGYYYFNLICHYYINTIIK